MRTALSLLAAFVMLTSSFAAEPPAAPILCIEAGMHTGLIDGVATDAAGRVALTCSHDKTARLWSLPGPQGEMEGFTSTLLRTLRIPIGEGSEGKLYCCALSPDGRIAALGGCTGDEWDNSFCIYLFDTTSGRMLRRLTQLPNVVFDLAFSASGCYLAAGLSFENGIRVWDMGSGQILGHDNAYGASCYGLDWLGDDTLVTTSWDGNIRLYRDIGRVRPPSAGASVPLTVACQVESKPEQKPFSIRFSPSGQSLAVGFEDSTAVAILATEELRLLHQTKPNKDNRHALGSVAWSSDGRHLFAGGRWSVNGQCPIRIWPQSGLGQPLDLRVGSTNTLQDLRALPGGGVLFATGVPAWGIVQTTRSKKDGGEPSEVETVDGPMEVPPLSEGGFRPAPGAPASSAYQTPQEMAGAGTQPAPEEWMSVFLGGAPTADHRKDPALFPVSADASVVAFSYLAFGKVSATFSLSDRRLLLGKTPRRLHTAREEGLVITDWKDCKTPKLDGKFLPLKDNETCRCIAIAPDARQFVLGADWQLCCIGADGSVHWERAVPGVVWGVNFSSDGRTIVVAYGDGTIRWHRAEDGKELLAFFPHADRKRWVLWTPAGWYDCSAGGEELIGWHVNRSKDREAEFFPAEKFRDSFYRPDILDELIRTWDGDAAVQLANARRGRTAGTVPKLEEEIAAKSPPVVELTVGGLTHTLDLAAGATEATLTYRVDGGSLPVSEMRVLVDGRPVDVQAPKPDSAVAEAKVTVPLPAHDCVVAVLAGNRHTFSEPALVKIRHQAAAKAPAARKKGRLYILAIGVSRLKSQAAVPGMAAMKHAAADASVFAAVLAKQTKLYAGIEQRLLTDEDATAGRIRDALDWLRTSSKTGDTALVFLAGHGESDRQGRYTYCAHDYDRARRLHTGVGFEDIKSTLGAAKSKVVLFLDAFSSGDGFVEDAKVDVVGLVNSLSDSVSNIAVFASHDGRGACLASEKLKQGVFAYSVKEGLQGKADLLHNGRITLSTLQNYVDEAVRKLSNNQQIPVISIPKMVPNMTLGLAP